MGSSEGCFVSDGHQRSAKVESFVPVQRGTKDFVLGDEPTVRY